MYVPDDDLITDELNAPVATKPLMVKYVLVLKYLTNEYGIPIPDSAIISKYNIYHTWYTI